MREKKGPVHTVEHAHSSEVNCVAFNPLNAHLLATGGSDAAVNLWDLRQISQSKKLHAFEGHAGGVYSVEWSPFSEHLLGSSGDDR
jgi:histone-binding protein RBBP4